MTTYDASTIQSVRLLIPDAEAIYGEDADENIFEDDDISLYLDMGFGNVKYAAGLACLAVGASEALILKVITNYETKTDGSLLMKQWTAKGQYLVGIGQSEIDSSDGGSFFFDSATIGGNVSVDPEGETNGWYMDPFSGRIVGR